VDVYVFIGGSKAHPSSLPRAASSKLSRMHVESQMGVCGLFLASSSPIKKIRASSRDINSTYISFFFYKLHIHLPSVCTGEGKAGKNQYGERRQKRIQQHETGLRFVTPLNLNIYSIVMRIFFLKEDGQMI